VTPVAERLIGVFEDGDEAELLRQCQDDLAAWGFSPLNCPSMADDILLAAKEAVQAGEADPRCDPAAEAAEGVTDEDARWYWSLPPLARAVMRAFDGKVLGIRWLHLHRFHLCLEELEQDVRRQLPTFGDAGGPGGTDAPLPWPLRRRFIRFMTTIRHDERAWGDWGERCRRASSMNALIREEIRAGRL
jgi:hypothetical protein